MAYELASDTYYGLGVVTCGVSIEVVVAVVAVAREISFCHGGSEELGLSLK